MGGGVLGSGGGSRWGCPRYAQLPLLLTSDFIRDEEVKRFRQRRREDDFQVFSVLIRACALQAVDWLAEMQMRPKGVKPLALMRKPQQDAEMADIAGEIQQILRTAKSRTAPSSPEIATLSALHQLPAPPADFTGRETELAELQQAVEQGGATILGLRGMGGIGKTALVLKLAEALKPAFPDAQLYLDLKGVAPQPLSPVQAMSHVIRAFHPDAKHSESPADRGPRLRSIRDGKRAPLLMDSAALSSTTSRISRSPARSVTGRAKRGPVGTWAYIMRRKAIWDPAQHVLEPECLDVAAKRLPEVGDRFFLSLPFPIGRDVGNTGREPAKLGVWNQLYRHSMHGLAPWTPFSATT